MVKLVMHQPLMLFFFGFLFLLFLLLALVPIETRITIHNLRQDKVVFGQLAVLLGGIIKFWQVNKTFPVTFRLDSLLEQGLAWFRVKDDCYKSSKMLLQKTAVLVYRFMHACVWNKLDLQVKLGLGDPARTALFTGLLRYLSGRGTPQVLRLLPFKKEKKPHFLFYPSFLKYEFVFSLSVSFTTSGLRLIYYSIKMILLHKLYLQGIHKNQQSFALKILQWNQKYI